MPLPERIVMVTGAGGALGRVVSRLLAVEGAHPVLVDRNEDRVQALARELADAHAFGGEIVDDASAAILVDRVTDEVGEIDDLVHLVGGYEAGAPIAEAGLDLWERMMAINFRSALVMIRAVLPAMLRRGSGRIVTIGSRAAFEDSPGAGPYAISKMALIRLTRTLAIELRDLGIQVNAVAPSIIDTPANRGAMPKADFEKWVKPEAVAQAIVFLLESEGVYGDVLEVYGRA